MDCDETFAMINHYLDGGLSQWRARAVSRHIDECPPCAGEHQLHVHYRQVIAIKCTEQAPYNLQMRVVSALGLSVEQLPLDLRSQLPGVADAEDRD